MDPLSAAGFASSLITFIDFSYKLIYGSVDLYKSAAGATDDNIRISSIVEDLKKITETISTPVPPGDNGPHTRELSRLALECHGVSKELTDILDKLKRREGNKAWRSLEAAWKSMRKSDKVAALENQLATYRMQLLLRLGIILAENQTSVEKQLSELQRGNTDHFAQTITQLGNVRQAIETLDKRVMDEAGHALHTLPDMNPSHGALDEIRAELSSIVQTLQAVAASTPADLHVLNRLYFESLHAREDDVRDAEFNTFAWLLHEEGGDEESSEESDEESGEESDEESIDSYYSSKTVASTGGSNHDTGDDADSPTHTAVANDEAGIDDDDIEDPDHGEDTAGSEDNEDADDFASVHSSMSDTHVSCLKVRRRLRKTFKKWLRLENGVFHIFGKAGSGKSTLMKRTCQDQVLRNELSVWAADRKLVLGSFFFWLSDNDSQCSLEGLYRSLLFEALRQCPELTRTAFPQFWTVANEANFETSAWTQSPFRLSELCQALQNLIEQQSGARTHRFCFFIDGLDEFKGDISDHRKLARQLRAWGSSPDVKICVSSRPDQAFLDVFDSKMRINIVDATKLDIYRFVKGTLAEQPATYLSPHILHEIAMQIWDRADGVFLWARLVVRSVTEGILYRSSHRALMDKVEQTPKGLGALFGQMFDSIDSSDRERSDRMLLFASRQGRGHFLLYSWLDDLADPGFPFEGPIRGLPMEEYLERKSTLAAQLKLLSKGLLEISEGSGIVDFFHRSVWISFGNQISSLR
ncbi:putative oxidoreductase yusZ [Verticillium dahliae VDG2]|nr:putative oxidoreductase yusZ [Verticillium dahliae VDG2]